MTTRISLTEGNPFSRFVYGYLGFRFAAVYLGFILLEVIAVTAAGLMFGIPSHLPRSMKEIPFAKDYIALLAIPIFVAIYLLTLRLLRLVPVELDNLVDNGATTSRDDEVREYSEGLASLVNHSVYEIIFSILFVVIFTGSATWLLLDKPLTMRTHWADPRINIIVGILSAALNGLQMFVAGSVTWRVLSIVRYLPVLGQRLNLRIRPLHPDKSGGLGPIGRICISLNLVALSIGLFIAAGFLFLEPEEIPLWVVVLIAYVVAATWVFFFPMMGVHSLMGKYKDKVLDKLSRNMERESERILFLLSQETPDPEKMREASENHERLARLYEYASRMPVWPFDLATLGRFVSYIGVPIVVSVVSIWLRPLVP